MTKVSLQIEHFNALHCACNGGTVKSLAVRASLQRPYRDHITTLYKLFEWVKKKVENHGLVCAETYCRRRKSNWCHASKELYHSQAHAYSATFIHHHNS